MNDIEAAAGDLATRGVRFERYDGMDQDERGITRGSDFPFIAAWFKDSAGNILEVLQERQRQQRMSSGSLRTESEAEVRWTTLTEATSLTRLMAARARRWSRL